ncbi:MAG: 50S ribosomal protein L24 [candidate division TM6 bacterium GW2011_GWF2_43_17]|nr:MAG: 50S ribosomal protein L24 [candidate division TM6 bacterium GW2011_GWF2_43_17]HAU30133.1 50S ribosomal protein L24 [Candidatus Dependentiae bacterium]
MKMKKNDLVVVVSGDDKGKTGPIIDVSSKKGKVKVQNVGVAVRHARARRQGETSGIRKQERWIDASNVKKIEQ